MQEVLVKLLHGLTSLIIAHRLSTIRNADKIIVIGHEMVAESGSHELFIVNENEIGKNLSVQQVESRF